MFKMFVCCFVLELLLGSQSWAQPFTRYFLEAEAICPDAYYIAYNRKEYGMGRSDLETGGMVVMQGKELNKGVFVLREAPFRLTGPAGTIPTGKYRLSLRVVRWIGAKGQLPIDSFQIRTEETSYKYSFPATTDALTPLGGVYNGDARWKWVDMPTPVAVGTGPLTVELSMTGGTGNYYGLLVDALELTPEETGKMASGIGEEQWSGDVAGTFLAELLPDVTHISLIAGDPMSKDPVNANMTIAPSSKNLLCSWIRSELPLKQTTVQFNDGLTESEELPLVQLLHAEPILPGRWYLLCLPSDDARLCALDRKRPWRMHLHATPLDEGVRLQTTDWVWSARKDLTGWSNKAKALSPAIREELVVAPKSFELKPEAVSSDKKLILWPGVWMSPDTHFLREHIDAIELAGVNGVTFSVNLKRGGRTVSIGSEIFSDERLSSKDIAPAENDLSHIDWKGLKASLLRVNVVEGDPQTGNGIDWFDQAAWHATLQNIRFCARLVKQAGVQGIMFDTEEYPPCAIFQYPLQKFAATKSFDDYAQQVFLRGQEFAQVCQEECPGITLVVTHGTSELLAITHPPFSPTNTHGSLLPIFMDGILSVEGPEIIDGYESSYSYRTPREFLEGDWQMDEAAAFSKDPALYRKKMGKGFGLYLDQGQKWNAKDEDKNYFSPSNLENTLHWALRYGRYVWIYSPAVNWFRDMTFPDQAQPSAAYDQALKASRLPHDPGWLPVSTELKQ